MSRKRAGLCITPYCRKPQRKKGGGYCSKCSMRVWRACNPMRAKFAILKDRARRKKVPFDLTLEWLEAFIIRTGYNSELHHIDRKVTWGGYTKDNLQVLSISENIAKGNRERRGQAYCF